MAGFTETAGNAEGSNEDPWSGAVPFGAELGPAEVKDSG
jgi:hypothetical protein